MDHSDQENIWKSINVIFTSLKKKKVQKAYFQLEI